MLVETLFQTENHQNVLIDMGDHGLAVQANQHLIVHEKAGIILDPGGHKVFSKVLSESTNILGQDKVLESIFLSHQDPDIIAAANGWLMATDAQAYISRLWERFVPHFGIDDYVADRLNGIPDEGMWIELGGIELAVIPAHFLHSCGNFQLYDPISKILYTGDLGASLGMDTIEVSDFDAHLPYMEGFHRRYMSSGKAMAAWARMASGLDIEMIAPQHGAFFRGKELVQRFIQWCADFPCGIDMIGETFTLPPRQPA